MVGVALIDNSKHVPQRQHHEISNHRTPAPHGDDAEGGYVGIEDAEVFDLNTRANAILTTNVSLLKPSRTSWRISLLTRRKEARTLWSQSCTFAKVMKMVCGVRRSSS